MVFGIAKEMADRFIEFVLKFFKGESAEDQLTKALKAAVLLISVLLFTLFTLSSTVINQRMDLADAEIGLAKINILFDQAGGAGGPLREFIRINDALTRQLDAVKNQNIILAKQSNSSSGENKILRAHLLKVLGENETLKRNNDVLLGMCKKP